MSASPVSSVCMVVMALTTSSLLQNHRSPVGSDAGEVGLDQPRGAGGVDEPGAVFAGHLVQRRGRELVDRGSGVLGGEVGGVGSPDEHRGCCDRGELWGGEDAFGARPPKVV